MTHKQFAVPNIAPTAFITQCKKRIRQYIDTVYLNHNDTFEIELFNPLTTRVLVKISLNNTLINSSGIVINPGQRVFLERYIDTNNKFKFETYEVSGRQALEAIRNNGHVKVEFYAETFNTYYPSAWTTNNWFNSTTALTVNGNCTCTADSSRSLLCDSVSNYISKTETGIIGKGSKSSQQFTTTNADFFSVPFQVVEWKILPLSTKPVEVSDLKLYCPQCGTRRKKDNHLYCYHCGSKF